MLMVSFSSQAAIGGWHCLAVDDQGRAYAWGMHTLLYEPFFSLLGRVNKLENEIHYEMDD